MAIVKTDNRYYADIAAAIRAKSGSMNQYRPDEMPGAILNLPTSSGNSEIIVYAPAGSVVTLAYGDTVRTVPESSGVWRFPECYPGSWLVTASRNGLVAEYPVEITEQGQLIRYEVQVAYGHIYGIVRDITSTSPQWTRTDEAEGKTACASAGTVTGYSDFDSCYPWSGIHREMFSTGDVMVKLPKFWYRRYREGNQEHIQIADNPAQGFALHPAFSHGGTEKDAAYIGAYSTSEGNLSKPGYTPRTGMNLENCRTQARSKGTGWGIMDVSTLSAIQMLYLVEFATYDSQTAVGMGYCAFSSSDSKQNTGGADSVPNLTGVPSGTAGKVDVVYRGMEGLWGNVFELLDGVIVDAGNQKYYVCNQPESFGQEVTGAYTCLDFDTPIKDYLNRYITQNGLHAGGGLEYIMFPSQVVSGSATTYLCDAFSAGTYSAACMRTGGRWNGNQLDGLFFCDVTRNITEGHAQNGSRLVYIPEAAL